MTSLGLATALDNARADPTQVCGRAVRGTDVACTRTSRLPGGPRPSRPLSAHHRGRPVRPSITPCCHCTQSLAETTVFWGGKNPTRKWGREGKSAAPLWPLVLSRRLQGHDPGGHFPLEGRVQDGELAPCDTQSTSLSIVKHTEDNGAQLRECGEAGRLAASTFAPRPSRQCPARDPEQGSTPAAAARPGSPAGRAHPPGGAAPATACLNG